MERIKPRTWYRWIWTQLRNLSTDLISIVEMSLSHHSRRNTTWEEEEGETEWRKGQQQWKKGWLLIGNWKRGPTYQTKINGEKVGSLLVWCLDRSDHVINVHHLNYPLTFQILTNQTTNRISLFHFFLFTGDENSKFFFWIGIIMVVMKFELTNYEERAC